jgi:Tol biopolymer transport system component
MRRSVPFLAAAMVTALAVPAVAQQSADKLSIEQYLDWERVGNPQLSPDGSQLIYTRSYVDKINDRWSSSLWIMNADGSRNRYLADGSQAQWSPDGSRIAFTKEGEPKGSQIFVRWMDAEGATSQITHLEHSPSSIRWAPDGESIAFQMTVEEDDSWRIDMPSRPEGAKWTASPKVVTRLQYRRDRVGFVDDGWRHIFVVPASGGTPRQLTDGDWHHNGIEWTPDGSEILFTSLRIEDVSDEHRWIELPHDLR